MGDPTEGGSDESDQQLGSAAVSLEPPAAPVPVLDGPFNPTVDLLALHYDHASARDDGLAAVAARELTDWAAVTPLVVGGAYEAGNERFIPESADVMAAAWGDAWLDAHGDRDAAVAATAGRWLTTIDAGGTVWVAEGGPSDFTAAVVRWLQADRPDVDTSAVIGVVQHSEANELRTTASDLAFVRANTTYVKIADGNHLNDTADFRRSSPAFVEAALAGANGQVWEVAFAYLDPNVDLDFSDAVLVLHLFGIEVAEVATPDDFAEAFIN